MFYPHSPCLSPFAMVTMGLTSSLQDTASFFYIKTQKKKKLKKKKN